MQTLIDTIRHSGPQKNSWSFGKTDPVLSSDEAATIAFTLAGRMGVTVDEFESMVTDESRRPRSLAS